MKRKNFKYKYIVAGKKVIALSTYAKKVVKGVAVCADNDEFNEESGKKLAALRCDEKVAQKRFKRAENEYNWTREWLKTAQAAFDSASKYYTESAEAYKEAKTETEKFLETL